MPENVIVLEGDTFQITSLRVQNYLIRPSYRQECELSYSLSHAATVSIRIVDPNGNYFRTLIDGEVQVADTVYTLRWDGTDDQGKILSVEGDYTLEITASDLIGFNTISRSAIIRCRN